MTAIRADGWIVGRADGEKAIDEAANRDSSIVRPGVRVLMSNLHPEQLRRGRTERVYIIIYAHNVLIVVGITCTTYVRYEV